MLNIDLLPKSKATNSYELLDDVCRAIEEEPKRFSWGDWVEDADRKDPELRPACNTLACVAGWMTLLTGHVTDRGFHVESLAMRMIPPSIRGVADDLFMGRYGKEPRCVVYERDEANDYVTRERTLTRLPDETQEEYAAMGIASIREFMADHEEPLKAWKLEL